MFWQRADEWHQRTAWSGGSGGDRDPILEADVASHPEHQQKLALHEWARQKLAWLGRLTRRQIRFFLIMLGLLGRYF